MATSKGVEKTLQKLRESVHAGNYYEAQQMYRTVARRYNKQAKYVDTIRLLHDGAILLFQHKQNGSGSDLANYMLDTYRLAHLPVDEASLDRIVEILNLFPVNEVGRKTFISNAFRWTKEEGSYPEGDPELHDFVGTMFYNEKKYSLAEDHLLLGTDHSAEVIGKVAYAWATEEKIVLKGIYLARIVFQLLAQKNIRHANLAYTSFIEADNHGVADKSEVRRAPADAPTPYIIYNDSWINLTQLVLLTVQRDGKDLFMELKSKYAGLYESDNNFVELIQDIGLVFFNIPKPRKQGNMLQEMMANLFGGNNGPVPTNALLGGGAKPNEDLD
ncbi:uncharacterized protein BX663DRAFT_480172 [Cokeromyces recurvatus]|uniref:uncharacterized protein n=1 Tax=Cokeromyces recurvatus TaxID=90255 RepID=UPI00221E7B0A|nr:uncharacterized protein BX663DRAFT_480172 [Cokeromyces recurvatus]KAI7898386.1 hypothetical protein BX663DRAFT_480172 [Cokeromyces recurvatus]